MDQNKELTVSFLLRLGLAVAFLYASLSALLNPSLWSTYIPLWVQSLIPPNIFLYIFSTYQFLLSLWLLFGKKTYYASLLSCLTLLPIIIFNVLALDIIFRDVAILCSAIALTFLSTSPQKIKKRK